MKESEGRKDFGLEDLVGGIRFMSFLDLSYGGSGIGDVKIFYTKLQRDVIYKNICD